MYSQENKHASHTCKRPFPSKSDIPAPSKNDVSKNLFRQQFTVRNYLFRQKLTMSTSKKLNQPVVYIFYAKIIPNIHPAFPALLP